MTEIDYWVVHSPYSDKSWRGIEKCFIAELSTTGHCNLLLFETEQKAQSFIVAKELVAVRPVKVKLVVPNVKEKL